MGGVTQENLLYLSVTKGRMVNKKKNLDFGGYEGQMLGIRQKDGEYEGKPQVKIEVKMKDTKTGEIAVVQFTKEAWYALGFFSRIRQVNLDKPFTLGVLASEQNEKMSFCYIKQEGHVNSKKTNTFEPDKSFPKYETITVSNKPVQDWTKPFAEMDTIIKHLSDRLAPVAQATKPADTLVPTPEDDLPF